MFESMKKGFGAIIGITLGIVFTGVISDVLKKVIGKDDQGETNNN